MPTARLNGISLNYETTGRGEPVVLVMGSGAGGRAWHLHQVPALVRHGYRAITFDNRGIGHSGSGTGGFTVDDLVADTAALIEHLDAGPCRLVGTSLGAHVAQELCLARPDLVSQVVLMATRGRTDVMRRAHARAEREFHDSGGRLTPLYAATLRALQNLSPATLREDKEIQDWLDIFEMAPVTDAAGYRAQLDVDLEGSRLDAYRAIRTPCQVIGFADDLVLPAALSREVADVVPGALYTEIRDAGHYGYLERPDQVNAVLLDFFARNG
ncbi:alpha/beta fold hydrolase [Streptomyces sp. NPDC056347]|uniref:alpha/beta fold hydrolase n=1 Tax=unclassified Streptomyces TaxID=2593676 RepID=UPI0035D553CB